jgi:spore coat protein CotH
VRKVIATLPLLVFALGSGASTAQAQTANDLFSSQNLQRVDLWLNSSDWSKLRNNFQENTYYPADLTLNGQTVYNVGI